MSDAALALAEPIDTPAAPPAAHASPWPLPARIGFRFLVSYFALYHFSLVDNSNFDYSWLTWNKLWHALIPWLGHHVFRVTGDISFAPTGSGDKIYDWLLSATFALAAAVATVVWSILDRRHTRYDRLAELLRVFLRYHIAIQMLGYGFAKVFTGQFPAPNNGRLMQAYGDSSPMGLLWTFMGSSRAYTIFAGAAEVLGATLVLFRRTATLGALVVLGVMINVAMINYCYDVPVKLFATHMVLMALIVIAPDARRLVDVLVLHRPTAPARWRWTPASKGLRWARRLVKAALVLYLFGSCVHDGIKSEREYGPHAPKPAYSGMYDVVEQPPERRYLTAYMNREWGGVRSSEGTQLMFDLPPKNDVVEVATRDQPPKKGSLKLTMPDGDSVVLDGTFDGKPLHVSLKRRAKAPLLISRGFHWVSPGPFNR